MFNTEIVGKITVTKWLINHKQQLIIILVCVYLNINKVSGPMHLIYTLIKKMCVRMRKKLTILLK